MFQHNSFLTTKEDDAGDTRVERIMGFTVLSMLMHWLVKCQKAVFVYSFL